MFKVLIESLKTTSANVDHFPVPIDTLNEQGMGISSRTFISLVQVAPPDYLTKAGFRFDLGLRT